MNRTGRSRGFFRLALLAALTMSPAIAEEFGTYAPEPSGLWTGPMLSSTPATLEGAKVIDIAELERLLPLAPVLIDVGPADRKPEGLSPSSVWLPVHRTIPGAVWFPEGGRADLPDTKVQMLLQRVAELSQADKSAPVVTFCQPGCWGSWNIGKRLVQAGYTSVHWLPAGVSGWQERNETTPVSPEAGWEPMQVQGH